MKKNGIRYTLKEKGKNWTVKEAVNAAGHVLSAHGRKGICVNSIKGRDLSEKISMEELNQISERIVSDSYHYA